MEEQIVIYSCDVAERHVFGVRGFFFHHYATHQAHLGVNRHDLAVLRCDLAHWKERSRSTVAARPQLWLNK